MRWFVKCFERSPWILVWTSFKRLKLGEIPRHLMVLIRGSTDRMKYHRDVGYSFYLLYVSLYIGWFECFENQLLLFETIYVIWKKKQLLFNWRFLALRGEKGYRL